jgi:D-3-phosphoglycerate dehydrogenase
MLTKPKDKMKKFFEQDMLPNMNFITENVREFRKIIDKNNAAHKGIWQKDAKGSFELRGKTLGIIGYGNIGSQVSVLAEALGMKVIFYDTITKLPLGNAESRKSLKDIVSQADIVTLHVPETHQTKNLINKTVIKQFKKGGILINYARGEVVDLDALKVALQEGQLSGAAIDVFPWEPEKNGDVFTSPLQNIPNVLLTPHVGGSTEEAQYNIGEDVSAKLLQYLEVGATYGSHTVPEINLPSQEGTHRILHIHANVPGVLSEINSRLSENKINASTLIFDNTITQSNQLEANWKQPLQATWLAKYLN